MNASLWNAWERIAPSHLLVVGDVILDRYTSGDAERISPEAPVPVLRIDSHEVRLGGAGSVAALLRGLGTTVTLAGVVGDDSEGRTIRKILEDSQIQHTAVVVDADRPTTWKERFIGRAAGRHPHQMLRVDREVRTPLDAAVAQQLLAEILPRIDQFQAILISDYGKGVCTPGLLRPLIDAATEKGLPVLVDPARGADWLQYSGASLLKPNRLEAQEASGQTIESPAEALLAARTLCNRFVVPTVLITLDRDGMALTTADGLEQLFRTEPRSVYDITGAGDMVLAFLGMGIAGGLSLIDTIPLANLAASLEVQRSGVTPITRKELAAELHREGSGSFPKIVTLNQLLPLVESYRQENRSIVLTNGCFDLLHVGHLTVLEEAAEQGDILIVAVNSDQSVRQLKGSSRPVIQQTERARMLAGLACVDYVLIFDEATPHHFLKQIRPDVLVKGGTYTLNEVEGREVVERFKGRVHLTRVIDGTSTTNLLHKLNAKLLAHRTPSDS